jgi:hypothetical protein
VIYLGSYAGPLGGWLGDGLPSWGRAGAPLDQVGPFWGAERLDGGTRHAATAAGRVRHISRAQSIKCCHRLDLPFRSHKVSGSCTGRRCH